MAAAAQPPINDAGYNACATVFNNKITGQPPGAYVAGPYAASAQVAGWADAGKLGGSLPLGYPVAGIAVSESSTEGLYDTFGAPGTDGQKYLCGGAYLQLDYNGQREFPPVTATFLQYGVIPVSATASFVQDGPAPLVAIDFQAQAPVNTEPGYFTVVTTSRVSLRVSAVKVNGVAMDVGGNCQTSGPVYTPDPVLDPGNNTLILSGGQAPGEPEPTEPNVVVGGAQAGLATIPPFTGCVTPSGENLDALLTSSLSGPANYVDVLQGPLCAAPSKPNCTTPTTNQPKYPPFWTISHGGPYSAAAPLTITADGGDTVITCANTAVSGSIADSAGPLRGPIGTFRWPGTLQCGGTGGSWTISQQGTATIEADSYDSSTQTTKGEVDNLTLDVQGPGGCTDTLAGAMGMTYSDATSTLTLAPGTGTVSGAAALYPTGNDTCDTYLSSTGKTPLPSATYPLGTGTTITSP